MKLPNAATKTPKINAIGYSRPYDSVNAKTIPTCTNPPNELNPKNLPSCVNVFFALKSRSSNVQILFKKKFVIIETVIPAIFAWTYQRFATTSTNNNEIK